MKRGPRPGELALVHSTEQTGDVQTFAVSRDNFDPGILRQMAACSVNPSAVYRLDPGDDGFTVVRDSDGARLTHNAVSQEEGRIRLHTTILSPMPDDEALMLADLEQCAALVLLGVIPQEDVP